jgi:hypothetical protein
LLCGQGIAHAYNPMELLKLYLIDSAFGVRNNAALNKDEQIK